MGIYDDHRPGNSDELYLRLKDGDAVKMRIISDPVIVLYEEGQRPRYAWLIVNHDNKKVQVFGAGISIYNQVADLVSEWGEPTDFDITVRRKGSGQFDTEYSVVPVKTSTEPTAEQLAEAEKIDLVNATKGKWLKDYIRDHELPLPVKTGSERPGQDKARAQADKLRKDRVVEVNDDEPINLDDIPFGGDDNPPSK